MRFVRVNKLTTRGGVFRTQQGLHRHVNKLRIAVVAFAIRKDEFEDFGEEMDIGRGVVPQRSQVIAFE